MADSAVSHKKTSSWQCADLGLGSQWIIKGWVEDAGVFQIEIIYGAASRKFFINQLMANIMLSITKAARSQECPLSTF